MDAQTRLGWVELYQEIGNAGVVCRRCGISRPTLRKWWRRYQALGMAGLEEQTRPNLEKKLGDLVEDGEEILITDKSFPTQFKYKIVYQK